ncbi:MAG: sigma-70 family RNA polymerase sigma factor, partial [Phycisphaerae bacterium]|nr:sigma-70 family RNA polymerase sigma factor [Phycisphaerae bacterium]
RLRQAVQSIAAEFDPTALKAFEMHILAGCPVIKTAEELGLSKWGVYRAKNRILKRVKEKLAELDPDADA